VSVFKTRHQGCASLCRFALGDSAHRRTFRDEDGKISFEFLDPEEKCPEIAQMFFHPEGAAVSDARALLDAHRAVRMSISAALNGDDKEWRNT
jgi:hypothetical protein